MHNTKKRTFGIFSFIIVIFLIATLAFLGYYLYQNLPGKTQPFKITQTLEPKQLENISNKIIQFYPNARFNHNNLSYFFENCEKEKQDRMKQAFSEITEKTQLITFHQTLNDNADILIGCSKDYLEKEKYVFIAGEGGPSELINSSLYPIIVKGKILLYDSSCKTQIIELHELLHVFGFDHINNSDYIMYPYADCSMHLNQEYIDYLKKLYSIKPLPELYFNFLNASKSGRYLDFNLSVANEGLINAENVFLEISSNQKDIETFELESIPFGMKKRFVVKNLKLPSRSTSQIKFKIETSADEYEKTNNIATATL